MGFLTWIVLGLIVGVLAKWILPGQDPGGLIVTTLLGIVGGLLGGFLGSLTGIGGVTGFNLVSFILALVGALVLLIGYRMLKRSSH